MPISQEELDQPPPALQWIPMYQPTNPNTFAMMGRFRCGLHKVWTVPAPDTPITEEWLRAAHKAIVETIVENLQEGCPNERPPQPPNPIAWQEFQWSLESSIGSIRKLLEMWARDRLRWAAAGARVLH